MKSMNRTGNMLTTLAIVAVFLGFVSSVKAQTSNQMPDRQQTVAPAANEATQAFTEKSLAQINKRFDELAAQAKANIDAKQKAVKNAEAKSAEARHAEAATASVLLVRQQDVDAAQSRV